MRRRLVPIVAVLGLFGLGLFVAAVAPASAVADENLIGTGSITYTWQGDPALGCAAVGLCDVQGALIIDGQGQADANSFGGNTVINLEQASPANVRVVSGTGASLGECLDLSGAGFGSLFIRHARPGRLVADLEPPLSSGRCAGPLVSDLARVRLPVRETGIKRHSFDLRTVAAFVAGPFAGRLVSTLVLRPGGGSSNESSGSSGSSQGPPPRHKILIEQVSLRYRVAGHPGALETAFSGGPDPFCGALDSCGSTGTVGLSLGGVQSTLTLTASRTVRTRVDARRALADLRRGRLRFDVSALASTLLTAETFVPADGPHCQESSSGKGMLVFGSGEPGAALRVSLTSGGPSDVLRTYCPGPSQTDVFAGSNQGQPTLARGSIGVARLLDRTSTVSLTHSGGFSGVGYVGSSGGGVGLSLSLEHVQAGTLEESAP